MNDTTILKRITDLEVMMERLIDEAATRDRSVSPMDQDKHPVRVCVVCEHGGAMHAGTCIVGRARELLNRKVSGV